MFGDEIPPIVDNSYKDTYLTIKGPAEATVRERGSRFLSFAYPVSSQKEADSYVAALRKKYYDATHHCFAWRMGFKGDLARQYDDGEPPSTAGRPILGHTHSGSTLLRRHQIRCTRSDSNLSRCRTGGHRGLRGRRKSKTPKSRDRFRLRAHERRNEDNEKLLPRCSRTDTRLGLPHCGRHTRGFGRCFHSPVRTLQRGQ